MSAVDVLVFPVALAALFATLCRLNRLHFREHKPGVILLHIAMGSACAAAAGHAWEGLSDITEVSSVVATLAWITVTYHTWRDGVPPQFESRPVPLDTDLWPHVSGGKGEP